MEINLKHPVRKTISNGNQVFQERSSEGKKHQKDVKKMHLPTAVLQQNTSFCFYKFLFSKRHILLIPSSPKVFCSHSAVSTLASACSYISNSSHFFLKPDTQWCVTERNGTLANWFLPSQGIHSVVSPPHTHLVDNICSILEIYEFVTRRNIICSAMIQMSRVQKIVIFQSLIRSLWCMHDRKKCKLKLKRLMQ